MHTCGYSGLQVVLVALHEEILWVIPGHSIVVSHIAVTPRGKWDVFRRTWSDLHHIMSGAWARRDLYLRKTAEAWQTPISGSQQIEHLSLTLCLRVFNKAGLSVAMPSVERTPVDMVVEQDIQVQIKARTKPMHGPTSSYQFKISKRLGFRRSGPYQANDFDALVLCILSERRLAGMFVFPASELLRQGLVGQNARTTLSVYPSWSAPRMLKAKAAKLAQAPYFLAFEGEPGDDDLARVRALLAACRRGGGEPHVLPTS